MHSNKNIKWLLCIYSLRMHRNVRFGAIGQKISPIRSGDLDFLRPMYSTIRSRLRYIFDVLCSVFTWPIDLEGVSYSKLQTSNTHTNFEHPRFDYQFLSYKCTASVFCTRNDDFWQVLSKYQFRSLGLIEDPKKCQKLVQLKHGKITYVGSRNPSRERHKIVYARQCPWHTCKPILVMIG